MAVSYTLKIDVGVAGRIGLDAAQREVTDLTRRVHNRATVLTPVDTGLLRAHNQMRVFTRGQTAVGEVFNDTEYAAAVHNGRRAMTIVPRRRKALKFKIGGRTVFARKVHQRARRGRPWLTRALQDVAVPAGFRVTIT